MAQVRFEKIEPCFSSWKNIRIWLSLNYKTFNSYKLLKFGTKISYKNMVVSLNYKTFNSYKLLKFGTTKISHKNIF